MSDFYNKYPYTDFHELNLDWVIERVKKLTEDWLATQQEWNDTEEQWLDLYNYVHDYFDNLNVQDEINNKINAMIADGTFVTITTPVIEAKVASMMPSVVSDQIGGVVASQINGAVAGQINASVAGQIATPAATAAAAWLNEHITQPTTPAIDNTLTIQGAAADAAATGQMTAPAYDNTSTYNAGDYINYNGRLYRCMTDITVAESWTPAHWIPTDTGKDLRTLNKMLDWTEMTVNSTQDGYYNQSTYTASTTRYTKFYDIRDIDEVKITGTFQIYSNVYTMLDENNNVVHYKDNTTANYQYSGVINTSDAVVLAVSSSSGTESTLSVQNLQGAFINEINEINDDIDYIKDKTIALLPLEYSSVVNGFYANTTLASSSSWSSRRYDLTDIDWVKIVAKTAQYVNEYTFLDENDTPVAYKQATATGQTNEYEFDCSNYKTLVLSHQDNILSYAYTHQNSAEHIPVRNDSNWKGKKIVWFGTSIPAGGYLGLNDPQSYPNILGKMLGCNMFNEAVGSSTVHCKITGFITAQNPYGYMPNFQSSSRCLSNDISDMDYIIANYNSGIFTSQVPAEMTTALAESIRDCSWERKLTKYLGVGNRADLYVFDVGYNDIRTLESQYDPAHPYDRHTFTGAMNFLLNKIFGDNPRAKVVMMGHYENQSVNGISVTDLQKNYSSMWLIDLFPLWEKTGFSQQYIQTTGYWDNNQGLWIDSSNTTQSIKMLDVWLRDGVHPHSDYTHRTERYIAELIYPWLNNIKGYDLDRNVKHYYPDP